MLKTALRYEKGIFQQGSTIHNFIYFKLPGYTVFTFGTKALCI